MSPGKGRLYGQSALEFSQKTGALSAHIGLHSGTGSICCCQRALFSLASEYILLDEARSAFHCKNTENKNSVCNNIYKPMSQASHRVDGIPNKQSFLLMVSLAPVTQNTIFNKTNKQYINKHTNKHIHKQIHKYITAYINT